MQPISLTFITRPDCHLCESAHAVVARVLEAVPEHIPVEYAEINLLETPEYAEKYAEFVPVILIDDVQHACFTVREDHLAQAIVDAYRERKRNNGDAPKPGRLTQFVRRLAKKSASS